MKRDVYLGVLGAVLVITALIASFLLGDGEPDARPAVSTGLPAVAADPVPKPHFNGLRVRPSPQPASRSRAVVPTRASIWARSSAATRLRKCEGGAKGYRAVSDSGKYRGAYQMDRDFWLKYGGDPRLTPDKAPPSMQDAVAYRGFLARGWQPWTCAKILGLR